MRFIEGALFRNNGGNKQSECRFFNKRLFPVYAITP